MADPDVSLESFVTYVTTHLTGDEKGEAADYLDHLFRALGHDGIKEAGASRERFRFARFRFACPSEIARRNLSDVGLPTEAKTFTTTPTRG